MGIPVLILGASGSGKSTSLRKFEENEVGIFNVAGKPLPFRKKLTCVENATYAHVMKALSKPTRKTYVIDDSQYLMAFSLFDKVKIKGYEKFTDIAIEFKNLIQYVIKDTPRDVIVYFLHHTETDDKGNVKAKTSGKMIDTQLTLEGLFSVVLLAQNKEGQYKFITQNDGQSTAKSPMDMFDSLEIDNDLQYVDKKIREYWNL